MTTGIHIICIILILSIVIFLLGCVTYTLRRVYLSMRTDLVQQNRMIRLVATGLSLWLLIIAVLSIGGYFSNYRYLPPRLILFGLFIPLVFTVFLLFSKSFTVILRRIPPSWLIKVQSYRIVLELMLILAFLGDLLPFQLTFLGFNMNIVAGITALFAGSIFFRKGRFLKPETVIWNIFGVLLLLMVVFIAIISIPAHYRIFMNEPSSKIISSFPFIWIPTFLVPLSLAFHLFSIKQVFIKDLRPFE